MILTKKKLRKLEESMFVLFTPEQEKEILDYFGVEPVPYEWTEQDIVAQIQKYLK